MPLFQPQYFWRRPGQTKTRTCFHYLLFLEWNKAINPYVPLFGKDGETCDQEVGILISMLFCVEVELELEKSDERGFYRPRP